MKFIRPVICAIVVFCIVFSLCYGLKRVNYADEKLTDTQNYKCIINLWHIDTFEGGVGSRAEFLFARAGEFEKKNSGVFVMVTTQTIESAEKNYLDGARPDIVSYGYGAVPENPLPTELKYTFSYGEYDKINYALPWCRGGYVILANKQIPENKLLKNAVVSQGEYTAPLVAVAFSGFTLQDPKVMIPTEAYYKFITGEADYLVGTQRDVNRIISRGAEVGVVPLAEYNDLYQYVSVTSTDSVKKYYASAYVDYVLSAQAQKKLYKIGMLSAFYDVEYDDERLSTLQNTKNSYGFNVFNGLSEYQKLKTFARLATDGNQDAYKKMKNFVV